MSIQARPCAPQRSEVGGQRSDCFGDRRLEIGVRDMFRRLEFEIYDLRSTNHGRNGCFAVLVFTVYRLSGLCPPRLRLPSSGRRASVLSSCRRGNVLPQRMISISLTLSKGFTFDFAGRKARLRTRCLGYVARWRARTRWLRWTTCVLRTISFRRSKIGDQSSGGGRSESLNDFWIQ